MKILSDWINIYICIFYLVIIKRFKINFIFLSYCWDKNCFCLLFYYTYILHIVLYVSSLYSMTYTWYMFNVLFDIVLIDIIDKIEIIVCLIYNWLLIINWYLMDNKVWISYLETIWKYCSHKELQNKSALINDTNDLNWIKTLKIKSNDDLLPLRNPNILMGRNNIMSLLFFHEIAIFYNLQIHF